jgi:hypothetical protein
MSARFCNHCGREIDTAGKAPRSVPQLRRYFAMLKAAFLHWPETAERQFASVEELRAYAQMKAGHREIGATIPLSGMNKERAMLLAEAAIRAAGSYAMPVLHGDTLVIFKPKSIAFTRLSHTEFCRLNDDVSEAIFNEIGMRGEQLLKETEAAA